MATKGIDFSQFRRPTKQDDTTTEERPKAKYWMNIGVETGDEERPFLSLPQGIPLDTMEKVKTNSSNADFRAFRVAQNDLLDQITAFAESLEPGESVQLPLIIELRRVNEETNTPITENKYAVGLKLQS